MALMKAVQVSKPGGQLELVERPTPEPGRGQVRIKVEACGICHSDVVVKDGLWPGLQYPAFPATKSPGASMPSARTLPAGRQASASVSAGTAAIASRAIPAGGAFLRCASIVR